MQIKKNRETGWLKNFLLIPFISDYQKNVTSTKLIKDEMTNFGKNIKNKNSHY